MMPAAVRAGRSKPRHTAFGIALALFGTLNDFLGSYCGGRIGTVNAKGHARLRTVDLQSRSAASSFRSSLTQQLGGLGAHLVRIPAEEIRDQLGWAAEGEALPQVGEIELRPGLAAVDVGGVRRRLFTQIRHVK
jgi:hypothetical protein